MKTIRTIITALVLASAVQASILTLTVYPNNDLVPPSPLVLQGNGNTVGIGFSLQNDAAGYLLVSGVGLSTDPSPAGSAVNWIDLLGPYFSNNSFVLAPDAMLSQAWVLNTAGLGEFTFDASPVAFSGPLVTVTLQYDLFDADPFAGPATQIGFGSTINTVVQFDVSAPLPAGVPEPGTFAMTGSLFAVLFLAHKRWKTQVLDRRTFRNETE